MLAGLDRPWEDALLELGAPEVARLRGHYLELARGWLGEATPRMVVDKLPLRFLDLPALRWLFPEARILFVARHPFDVMLSNYMQQYVPTEAFVHFDTPERAASTCATLLRSWRRMGDELGCPHFRLRYEDLVEQPVPVLESLGRWLGRRLDPEALDPHRRLAGRGRIATNSYQQVAEPLYRRAVGRWRRYARLLDAPFAVLADEARRLGYEVEAGARVGDREPRA